MGCAVATAAMLAGMRYEKVAAHWPRLHHARLRCPKEFCALLESVTDTEWNLSPCWHPLQPITKYPFPPWPVAVFMQDAELSPRFGQWVAVADSKVYDPGEFEALDMSGYRLRDWLVTSTVQPAARRTECNRIHSRDWVLTVRTLLRLLGGSPMAG